MPPKKMGRARKQKRKRIWDEAENISHSESITDKNSLSESWECPVSARRDVIPNSMEISDRRLSLRSSDRRLSLRSSKRLFETGNTSLPASQVPEGSDVVESPSKYLVQAVYPLTVGPHSGELGVAEMSMSNDSNQMAQQNALALVKRILGLDDAENVEKSTVGIPEKLGEFGEAEMSLSYANRLVGQNTFLTMKPHLGNEAEIVGNSTIGIPEKVGQLGEAEMSLADHTNQRAGQNTFEAEEIQASNKFEKIINKNHRKSISRADCTSPSFTLKLTEVVAMVQNDGDDVDSEIQSRLEDTVNGYQVKPEFMPILRKIINKHGDIAKNCMAKSVNYRSKLLELICEIISEFEMKNLSKIKESVLKSKIGLVDEMRNMKVEVEWLRMRLAEVYDARDILKQFAILKEKTDDNRKLIEDAKSELVECEEQKKEVLEKLEAIRDKESACKQRLASATDDSTKISRTVRFAKSKVKRFLYSSVMDGLI
ncbi:hypothetical protein TSUD_69430 [Trifolium subterraneum]|uniref:Phospholipase-like protein n=1 Tax=Trifolium subterraneum TaxID=3900 RepID=A0A2Z6NHM4_TRISU|nr:hypothetical protein TSUD_69430 [Trifolium subterraneum]